MVDVPAEAVSLGQFVRAEAGDELAAIKGAFERLVAAPRDAAVEGAFAAAVERFHMRARRPLYRGEYLAFGRPLADAWAAPIQIEGKRWPYLVWGEAGESCGLAGVKRAMEWKPRPADAFSIAWTEAFGRIELPGCVDLSAELAFEWMKSVRLDAVRLGLCPQDAWDEKYRTGWRALGIAFNPTPAPIVCRVVRAAALSPEAACRAWLQALVEAGDPEMTKPGYLQQAQKRFRLSRRAFNGVWAEVTRDRPAWTRPGRRS